MHTAVSHSISPIAAAPLGAWIRRAGLHLRIWTEAYAAAAADAALYAQLSGSRTQSCSDAGFRAQPWHAMPVGPLRGRLGRQPDQGPPRRLIARCTLTEKEPSPD